MQLLNDLEIARLCINTPTPMISPFVAAKTKVIERNGVSMGAMSFGVGHFGYDIRLAREFKFPPVGRNLDPKNPKGEEWTTVEADDIWLPAGQYVLGRSVEYFQMPPDVIGVAFGKSSYARAGVLMNVMPLEPGWGGYYTIAINNVSCNAVRIYAEEGAIQILFMRDDAPEQQYSGKYQNAAGIEQSKV